MATLFVTWIGAVFVVSFLEKRYANKFRLLSTAVLVIIIVLIGKSFYTRLQPEIHEVIYALIFSVLFALITHYVKKGVMTLIR